MKIPPYSKKRHIARDLFQKITAYNPELLLDMAGSLSESSESYSDMPKLINRLMDIFNSSSIKTKPQSRARHSDPTAPEDIITDLQK